MPLQPASPLHVSHSSPGQGAALSAQHMQPVSMKVGGVLSLRGADSHEEGVKKDMTRSLQADRQEYDCSCEVGGVLF
eukprot:51850-Eustigmatos_ZCMA.PRE.2